MGQTEKLNEITDLGLDPVVERDNVIKDIIRITEKIETRTGEC